ncbi:hypothetical protein DPMN_021960 [Dreissena polymorpha]|uniref:Uncharacterized protein n=1 Tax=Dreissena polymorpha TaxID=45954 RepID=A0A9D4SBF9_DREPO|nr:hypothetical protein DPMN_151593 [Dreissena polymorpha]KAH3897765.1 hypothetical protein DPMN_021960 [Dreissena polymorpha]
MSFMMRSPDMEQQRPPTSLNFDTAEPFTRQSSSVLSSCCNVEQTNIKYVGPVSLLNTYI